MISEAALLVITLFTILGLVICFIKSIKKSVLGFYLIVLLLGTFLGYFGIPTIERIIN